MPEFVVNRAAVVAMVVACCVATLVTASARAQSNSGATSDRVVGNANDFSADQTAPSIRPLELFKAREPVSFESTAVGFPVQDLEVRSLDLSPNGKLVAVGHGNWMTAGLLRVYEWPSGQLLKSIPQPKGLATATFSPDGTLLAIATWEHDVIVYDAASWAEEARMKSPSSVARLAFSPDGQWLAMASESAALWAFRVGTWDERRVFQGDLFRLQHLAFSPDGKTIVAGGGSFDNTRYGRVIGFDFEQASEIWTKNAGGQPILGIAFSPDGRSVAACGYEPLIQMFNARTGEPGQTIQLADSGGERILFTKDGSLHIACFDGSVRTFRDGEPLRAFAAHEGAALELEMTDDGQTIFTGGADSLVHVWNAEDQRLKSTLKPHIEQADLPEPVHALAASLDGRWVATAHEDLSVRVRDAASGRLLTSVNGHDDLVVAVAFSPDGKWLATGSYDQSIKLWPIATEATQTVDNETERAPRFGEPRELTGHTNWVFAIAFSPDGQRLASAGYDKSVRLWDVETGKELAKFDGHTAAARCVAFSPDGKRLVSGSSDRTAMVWDMETHKAIATITGHTGAVRGVSYSPDGQQFATGSEDNSIRIWDANSGQQLRELSGHENMVWCVAYSPRGATLVSGGFDRSVRLWNPFNGKLLQTMKSHEDVVTSVIYLPDSRALISAGYDKKLLRWNAKEPPIPPLAEIQVAEKDGARFAFVTPDQRRLVTGSTTRQVKFWDLATGQLIESIDQQRGVSSGAISRDGHWLLTGGYGEQIYMWDITSMEQVAVIETGHEESTSVAFSPDGQQFAAGAKDGVTTVFSFASREKLRELPGDGMPVEGLSYSPDGTLLASASGDYREWRKAGHVRLWDPASGEELADLPGTKHKMRRVMFTPDGQRLLACGSQHEILVYDVAQKTLLHTITTNDEMSDMALLPDNRTIVCGQYNGTVSMWDLERRIKIGDYEGHRFSSAQYVFAVSTSVDGSVVFSSGSDGSVKLWPTTVERTASPIAVLEENHAGLMTVALSPDGRWAVTAGKSTDGKSAAIYVHDVTTGKQTRTIEVPRAGISYMRFSPDGRTIALCFFGSEIELWDFETGHLRRKLTGHSAAPRRVDFSPDGKRLVSGGWDRTWRLWNVESGESLFNSPQQPLALSDVAFSPDNRYVATCTGSWKDWRQPGEVKLWDAATGREITRLGEHRFEIKGVMFDSSSRRLLSHGVQGVKTWDVEKQSLIASYGNGHTVTSAVISPDEQAIMIGTTRGEIARWELSSGAVQQTYEAHAGLIFDLSMCDDGSLMAGGSQDGVVTLWMTRTPTDENAAGRLPNSTVNESPPLLEVVKQWASSSIGDETSSNP